MGNLYRQGADPDAGYAERVLAQTAGALLKLATPGEGPQQQAQVAEAKVILGSLGLSGAAELCTYPQTRPPSQHTHPHPTLIHTQQLRNPPLHAQVALGKALKHAHNRLHSHQLVTQLLNAMAPLRVDAADIQGAQQMLTSSFTLSKGMGDLNGQVAALGALQQVYGATRQAAQAAQNGNYLARKTAELGVQLAAAEADGEEHAAVLGWDL